MEPSTSSSSSAEPQSARTSLSTAVPQHPSSASGSAGILLPVLFSAGLHRTVTLTSISDSSSISSFTPLARNPVLISAIWNLRCEQYGAGAAAARVFEGAVSSRASRAPLLCERRGAPRLAEALRLLRSAFDQQPCASLSLSPSSLDTFTSFYIYLLSYFSSLVFLFTVCDLYSLFTILPFLFHARVYLEFFGKGF